MKPQDDDLLQRYREASEHDPARPGPSLREKVLAHARAAAQDHRAPGVGRSKAANDTAWRWRALGGLAVLGLATLVMLQFERGTPEDRALAFGEASTVQRTDPAAEAAPMPHGSATPPPPPVVAPVPVPARRAPTTNQPNPTHTPQESGATPPPSPRRESAPPPLPAAPAPSPPAPVPPPAMPSSAPQTQARAISPADNADAARARSFAREPEAPATLSARGAPPVALDSMPRSPGAALLDAAARDAMAQAREALAQGADVNATDTSGRSALMLAARRGDAPLVRLLIDAGADTQHTDREGLRAADHARRAGHAALARWLEDQPTPR